MSALKNLQERAKSLPEDIKSYLFSIKASEINAQIFAVSGLEINKYPEISLLIAEVILKEKALADLETKLQELLSWPPEKVASFTQEIVGSRLLVCDRWLNGEAEKYLRSKNADISHYATLVAEQQLAISKEEEFFREQLKDDTEINEHQSMDDVLADDREPEEDEEDEEVEEVNEVNIKNQEKGDIDIETTRKTLAASLKGDLVSVFLTDNPVKIENYNYLFIRIWNASPDFHLEAQNSLMANQEKIADAKIEVDGRVRTATISGLLKNFIKKYGIEANDLNIAEYVSSPELKEFSDNEKALSLRILKFFRNINKLDEYLAQQKAGQIEGFEILPLAANQSAIQSEAPRAQAPKHQPSQPLVAKPLIQLDPVPVKPIAPVEPIKPISVGLAAELEMMLQDYAPGSLEYKTLQQELKRLEQKK